MEVSVQMGHKSGFCQSPERMSSNGIMSSSSMGQDTHTPLPSSLISLPPSVGDLSSQGQKTCMDGLPLWQNLCPFHRSSRKLQKIAGEAEPERSPKLLCQSLSTASSTLLRASERIQPVFPNFAPTQARKGVVFSRVGSQWFPSWSHCSVAVWPWASNSHFTA